MEQNTVTSLAPNRSRAKKLIAENNSTDDDGSRDIDDDGLLFEDEYVPATPSETRRMCVACFTRPCRNASSVFCSNECVRSVAAEVAAGNSKVTLLPRHSVKGASINDPLSPCLHLELIYTD